MRSNSWLKGGMLMLLLSISLTLSAEQGSVNEENHQQIPFKKESVEQQVSLARVGITFSILVGLLVAAAYGYKRLRILDSKNSLKRNKRIMVVESKGLPGKATISLVRVDTAEYLVVRTHQDLSILEHKASDGD